MQTIQIDIKDAYVDKVLTMLDSLQNIMIESIRIDTPHGTEYDASLIELQEASMRSTWENDADEAWDAV